MSATEQNATGQSYERAVRSSKRRRNIIIVLAGVLVILVLGIFGFMVSTGALAPASAAAKYGTLSYVSEDDVTDYVNIYRTQSGYGNSTDDEWAAFLLAQGTTPSELRTLSIYELIGEDLIEKKCDELGITVSDEELDATITNLKSSLALGDDETWAEQLETYGTSEDNLREVYRHTLLRQKLVNSEVETPTPTNEQIKEYMVTAIASYSDTVAHHTYCLRVSGLDEEGETTKLNAMQDIRKQLIEQGVTEETFSAFVGVYSDDESLIETGGANGWDIDVSDYSENYQMQLSNLGVGEVSTVFVDGDSLAFIWVDQEFELPLDQETIENMDLENDLPSSLLEYYSDCEAYQLWVQAGNDYTDAMLDNANVIIFPMPTSVSYYVDLDAYAASTSEGTGTEGTGASSEEEASGEDAAANGEEGDASE